MGQPAEAGERPALSIIIPALNEAHSIGATIAAAKKLSGRVEVIVVDGGSRDETIETLSGESGVRVIRSERGRGLQMHAGACLARGEALWFLHADTLPPADAAERIAEALGDTEAVGGNFCVRFDGERAPARFLTWLYPRLRRLGLCYGDSAIFVRASAYRRVGGFKPFPIFEDLDLVRRLRRMGRMAHLPATVITSSRRFENRSFAFTFARWALLQALYWMGADPQRLGRMYAPVRARSKAETEVEQQG